MNNFVKDFLRKIDLEGKYVKVTFADAVKMAVVEFQGEYSLPALEAFIKRAEATKPTKDQEGVKRAVLSVCRKFRADILRESKIIV